MPKTIYASQKKEGPESLPNAARFLLSYGLYIMALGALLFIPCIFVRGKSAPD